MSKNAGTDYRATFQRDKYVIVRVGDRVMQLALDGNEAMRVNICGQIKGSLKKKYPGFSASVTWGDLTFARHQAAA